MHSSTLWILFSLLCCLVFGKSVSYDGDKVLKLTVETQEQVATLMSLANNKTLGLDFWTHIGLGTVDLRVPIQEFEYVDSYLTNIKKRVMIENVQHLIDNEVLTRSAQSFFDSYQSTEDIVKFLEVQPNITKIEIGVSYLNNTIHAFKIGSGKFNVVFNGGVHAREWISPAVVTYLANFLASSDA